MQGAIYTWGTQEEHFYRVFRDGPGDELGAFCSGLKATDPDNIEIEVFPSRHLENRAEFEARLEAECMRRNEAAEERPTLDQYRTKCEEVWPTVEGVHAAMATLDDVGLSDGADKISYLAVEAIQEAGIPVEIWEEYMAELGMPNDAERTDG